MPAWMSAYTMRMRRLLRRYNKRAVPLYPERVANVLLDCETARMMAQTEDMS